MQTAHGERVDPPTPSRSQIWRMFDCIAARYDFLNRALSAGLDVAWRKRMARYLPDRSGLHLVDLATGTADQLLLLASDARVKTGEGYDLSKNMLAIGRGKIRKAEWNDRLSLSLGDATDVPLDDACADVVTITFGIRNVEAPEVALREMFRILKPGGRALVLEFSMPSNAVLRSFYLFYFRHVLPRIAGWISGNREAYQYLNRTAESFPYGENFCAMIRAAGFEDVLAHPLTFGIATIYQADRPG